jgi:hypothetical protein
MTYEKLSTQYKAFVTSITLYTEPKNYLEAILSPEWRATTKTEITALELNDT